MLGTQWGIPSGRTSLGFLRCKDFPPPLLICGFFYENFIQRTAGEISHCAFDLKISPAVLCIRFFWRGVSLSFMIDLYITPKPSGILRYALWVPGKPDHKGGTLQGQHDRNGSTSIDSRNPRIEENTSHPVSSRFRERIPFGKLLYWILNYLMKSRKAIFLIMSPRRWKWMLETSSPHWSVSRMEIVPSCCRDDFW